VSYRLPHSARRIAAATPHFLTGRVELWENTQMNSFIHPYLHFDGRMQEAMQFYLECPGGTLQIQTIKDGPMAAHFPAEQQGLVMHSSLVNGDRVLMASDMTRGQHSRAITSGSICLAVQRKNQKPVFPGFQQEAPSRNHSKPCSGTPFRILPGPLQHILDGAVDEKGMY
jgi:PhnB protein